MKLQGVAIHSRALRISLTTNWWIDPPNPHYLTRSKNHLKQFHFHLPSEHLDNGTSMAMEMHMVHQSEDKKLAVIGLYIDLDDGLPNATYKAKAAAREATGKDCKTTQAQRSTVATTVLNSVDKIATLGQTTHTKPLKMSEIVSLLEAGEFQS